MRMSCRKLAPTPSRLLTCLLAVLMLLLILEIVWHNYPRIINEETRAVELSKSGNNLHPDLNLVERTASTGYRKESNQRGELNWRAEISSSPSPRLAKLKPAVTLTTKLLTKRDAATTIRGVQEVSESASDLHHSSTSSRSFTTLHPDLLEARKRVKNVKLFQPFVTKQERQVMLNLLKIIDKVFRMHNVTYIMYGGTLLGSHRHHGLVPWDDDIDLLVNKTDRRRLPAMLAAAAPSLVLQEAGGHDKIYDRSLSRRTNSYRWRWPYLDISFFEENSTHLWDHMATYSHWFVYPKWLVFPIHARPFEHLWLPVPHDTLAFLQMTYGRTGTCLTSAYSHMIEDGMPSGRKPCLSLNGSVPFVHRKPCELVRQRDKQAQNCVMETLVLGNRPIKPPVSVPEPSFAINEPFSLKLVDGFTQPPHYPSMSDSDL